MSWTQVCGCSNVQHSNGSVDFREVARALWILRTCRCQDWTQDDIISIFDELTSKGGQVRGVEVPYKLGGGGALQVRWRCLTS